MTSSSQTIASLPGVQLQTRSAAYSIDGIDFLIGAVPGCDLRVGGESGVICLIARHPTGASLRKLAPTQTILVNGQTVSQCELNDGDRVQIGTIDMKVSIAHHTPASGILTDDALEQAKAELHEAVEQFREQLVRFQQDKDEFARQRQQPVQVDELEERALEIDRQQRELAKVRQEMADLRKQLYDHYQEERRDKLASMEEDLHKTHSDLDEREKKLRLEEQDFLSVRTRERDRHDDLERRATDVGQRAHRLDEERRRFEEQQQIAESEWAKKNADLEACAKALTDETRQLAGKIQQYEADVVRLHRQQGEQEKREAELTIREADLSRDKDALIKASSEVDEELRKVEDWRAQLADESERLAIGKQAHDERARQLDERAASLEGQQASLAVLRTRLERMRDEMRAEQQRLDAERDQQEERAADLKRQEDDLARQFTEMEVDRTQYTQDREQWLERGAVMEAAVRQLKLAQEELTKREKALETKAQSFDDRDRQLAEADGVLQGRLNQLAEAQERLDLERQALRDRGVNLVEREEACRTLQEQLHRRTDEIASRHKEITEQLQSYQGKCDMLNERGKQLDARELELQTQIETWRIELEQKSQALQMRNTQLDGASEAQVAEFNQLAVHRQAHARERAEFQLEQQAALEKFVQARAELEAMRRDALTMIEQLPDAELRAGGVIDRLGQAREQLRHHLGEIHQYVRQCQDELAELRTRLQADLDKLVAQEETLRRNQDEHRVAAVEFRQHLIDWQGQITDLKRVLARDESRLERREAKVDERARAMEAEEERLAQQAVNLVEQEREVADWREEIDGHLVDMREWYRGKLRELAGIPLIPRAVGEEEATILPVAPIPEPVGSGRVEDGDDPGIVPTNRSILSLAAGADAGDRKLGQLLRDAQLIDADTLTALLAEARRQRRSLRQVLLASGVITLYQLALIEAGNVDGLMMGPVRVIDRLRNNAHETVYRVFDPRRGAEAVLRHLSEADAADAVKPDEFRQRFTQAKLNDVHVANTLEVLDLAGRPAAMQEWLTGLAATDWPPLAAAPGVCYRLLTQAAQGLAAAHQAGAVHGHLSDSLLLLTGDGVLKICGLGEPPWLVGLQLDDEPTPQDDLRTLGKIVAGWCTPTGVRKGAKTKPLPEALVSILYRMASPPGAADQGYRDVQELLTDLQNAGSAIPPNSEAWDRLVKYVRDHGTPEALLRQSA